MTLIDYIMAGYRELKAAFSTPDEPDYEAIALANLRKTNEMLLKINSDLEAWAEDLRGINRQSREIVGYLARVNQALDERGFRK
jgi:hypothetical protein